MGTRCLHSWARLVPICRRVQYGLIYWSIVGVETVLAWIKLLAGFGRVRQPIMTIMFSSKMGVLALRWSYAGWVLGCFGLASHSACTVVMMARISIQSTIAAAMSFPWLWSRHTTIEVASVCVKVRACNKAFLCPPDEEDLSLFCLLWVS